MVSNESGLCSAELDAFVAEHTEDSGLHALKVGAVTPPVGGGYIGLTDMHDADVAAELVKVDLPDMPPSAADDSVMPDSDLTGRCRGESGGSAMNAGAS